MKIKIVLFILLVFGFSTGPSQAGWEKFCYSPYTPYSLKKLSAFLKEFEGQWEMVTDDVIKPRVQISAQLVKNGALASWYHPYTTSVRRSIPWTLEGRSIFTGRER